MQTTWQVIFWLCVAVAAYTYIGYPGILLLVGSLRRRHPQLANKQWPSVTLLIVAYNEERVIGDKIENSLALDYPSDKLEIIVASDASTDGTDRIVREYADRGIHLIRRPTRGSQTGAQSFAAPHATGAILVFSDANSMYAKDALRNLITPFGDPQVGCVVGRLRTTNPRASVVSFGEELYYRYEAALKRAQSAAGALLFANGAIYAVRRSLYRPVEGNYDHDTIIPLRCKVGGLRVVYQPWATAYEETTARDVAVFRQKVRIIMRDAWTFIALRFMMAPLRPWIAFNIVSHKLLRWTAGAFLLVAVIANLLLLPRPLYVATFAVQAVLYGCAVLQLTLPTVGKRYLLCRIAYYFCLVNAASLVALGNVMAGKHKRVWEPRSW